MCTDLNAAVFWLSTLRDSKQCCSAFFSPYAMSVKIAIAKLTSGCLQHFHTMHACKIHNTGWCVTGVQHSCTLVYNQISLPGLQSSWSGDPHLLSGVM